MELTENWKSFILFWLDKYMAFIESLWEALNQVDIEFAMPKHARRALRRNANIENKKGRLISSFFLLFIV